MWNSILANGKKWNRPVLDLPCVKVVQSAALHVGLANYKLRIGHGGPLPKKNEEKYQLTYIPIKLQKLNPSHRFIQHNFGSWFSPLPNIVFQEAKKSKVERSSIEWFLRKRTMVPNVE